MDNEEKPKNAVGEASLDKPSRPTRPTGRAERHEPPKGWIDITSTFDVDTPDSRTP